MSLVTQDRSPTPGSGFQGWGSCPTAGTGAESAARQVDDSNFSLGYSLQRRIISLTMDNCNSDHLILCVKCFTGSPAPSR